MRERKRKGAYEREEACGNCVGNQFYKIEFILPALQATQGSYEQAKRCKRYVCVCEAVCVCVCVCGAISINKCTL